MKNIQDEFNEILNKQYESNVKNLLTEIKLLQNKEELRNDQEADKKRLLFLMKEAELLDIKKEHEKFKKLSEKYFYWKYKGSFVQKIIANGFLEKVYKKQKESVEKKFEDWKEKWEK